MKRDIAYLLTALLTALSPCCQLMADGYDGELQNVVWKLNSDMDIIDEMMEETPMASEKRLTFLGGEVARMKVKGDIYCQAKQELIATDESVMDLAARYFEQLQQATDSIAHQQTRLQALSNFDKANKFIFAQDSAYKRMRKEADKLSLTQYTAEQLEQLKGRELLISSDMDNYYAAAKEAAQGNPSLKKRFSKLEEHYIKLKKQSGDIQAAEYKPLITRIKDYLIGFAAIGVILMFVNMLVTKIQVYKQVRDNAKKVQEMMRKNNGDYPQI